MSVFQPRKFIEIREQMNKLGIDKDILEHLDTLSPENQEDIALLFKAVANDELLFILSLKELDFVENRIKFSEEKRYLN